MRTKLKIEHALGQRPGEFLHVIRDVWVAYLIYGLVFEGIVGTLAYRILARRSRILGGGRLSPQFYPKSVLFFILSTVRAKPGSPQVSEAYSPSNAVQNPMLDRRTKSVFQFFYLSTVVRHTCQTRHA